MADTEGKARADISMAEWLDPNAGWTLYRSFQTAGEARWYFDRLPDEDNRHYAIVARDDRHIIVCRETFAHRN